MGNETDVINTGNKKRMAKNTIMMYFRMFFIVFTQLYTVPVVLRSLGVEDYGIYSAVGGFVAMFTFIHGSLIGGCQRFLAYAIGKNDFRELKSVFESNLLVFLCISVCIVLILELVGEWFLNKYMTIPEEKLVIANWVLQFAIFSLFFSIIAIPFTSLYISHERMDIYAYVCIIDGLYKLTIAFLLILPLHNKLLIYSFLMFLAPLFSALFYYFNSKCSFAESRNLRLRWDRGKIKELGVYAGWNIMGFGATIMRNHGINVLMNVFFNPLMNAAHSIANQVNGFVSQLANGIYIASRPHMVKQFAQGNLDEMWNVVFITSKYSFYLISIVAVPLLLELPTIMKVWLNSYPLYVVPFSRLMIISLLIETTTNQLIGAFQAANKIKYYQSVSSVILLSILPMSLVFLLYYSNPLVPYVISVFASFLYSISLLYIAYRKLDLNVLKYVKNVIGKEILVFSVTISITYLVFYFSIPSLWRVIVTFIMSTILALSLIWTCGMSNNEKIIVQLYINKRLRNK